MKLLATLDRRDRRLLAITAALVLCTIVLLVLVHPQEQEDSGIPSTYSTAPHGAKAAYLLLAQLGRHSGYQVERSEAPLTSVADAANAHTVLILAEPMRVASQREITAIRQVLAHGGRVLAAGSFAAVVLPDNNLDSQAPLKLVRGICEAQPNGFSPIAAGGNVVMREIRAGWKRDLPGQQAVYTCADAGVVVTYPFDKGTVVWWASATPLENQDIAAESNLALLMSSLHLAPGDHIVWDESLHAEPAAAWNPLRDRVILALLAQLFVVALLLVLARGRRSGPLRPLPASARSSPMEFVRALGGLYRASHANDVPVTIAYERFRAVLAQRHGVAGAQTAGAATLATALTQRFGITSSSLQHDLEACEGADRLSHLNARQALALVQALAHYQRLIAQQSEFHPVTDPYPEKDRGTIGLQHEHAADARAVSDLRRSA